MKDAIETLCSIDTHASQIMDNAAQKKQVLAREFDEKAQVMSEKIKADAKQRMKELAAQLDTANAREIQRLAREARENLLQLDENYNKNHDQYVQGIFSRITGA